MNLYRLSKHSVQSSDVLIVCVLSVNGEPLNNFILHDQQVYQRAKLTYKKNLMLE